MMSPPDFLLYLNILLTVGLTIGGIFAFRRGYSKEIGERQAGLIKTLKDEVAVLTDKVSDLEKERATQDRVIATIRYALRQYNLKITIAGDFVTINDNGKSKTTRIQPITPVKPLASASGDDDDDETAN